MAKRFTPVRGKDADIRRMGYNEGYVYFAIDTGFIYLDMNGEKHTLGGSGTGGGSSFIWADADEDINLFKVNPDDEDDMNYAMSVFAIEGSTEESPKYPQNGLMVINSDGRFFRVTGDDAENDMVNLYLIAVSGGGTGGGGGGSSSADLTLTIGEELYLGAIFLYGQDKDLTINATSTKDTNVLIEISAIDIDSGKTYYFPSEGLKYTQKSGVPFKFNAALLPASSNLTLIIRIDSSNSTMKNANKPKRIIEGIKVVKVGLAKYNENAYLPLVKPDDLAGELTISYIPYGDAALPETLHVYIDDEELRSAQKLIKTSDFNVENLINIPRQTHGTHNIKMDVSVEINGATIHSDLIEFEGAWASAGEEDPIIWIGSYDPVIINYENSYIKYMVYDPVKERNGLAASVYKYKDGIKIMESEESYSADSWLVWDITNSYDVGEQRFSLVCRNTSVDIPIEVTTEGSRDLGLNKAVTLITNFTAAGRSNSEVKSTRSVWQSTIKLPTEDNYKQAILSGFNWLNNGWRNDGITTNGIDNGTYLSLSNGASVTIPMSSINLNYDSDYSIEMRFRIRNVQEYSTLVLSLPLYYYYDEEGRRAEEPALKTWIDEHGYELVYDEYGSPIMAGDVEKSYKTEEGVICKWMNNANYGLVIGSQEAYFRSPRGVISVRYKEDEVINISCVISKTDGLVYIYLNGILSGADSLPMGSFDVESDFSFNSNYCDIDLYRFRIFKSGLTMPDVIHNYLSDLHSIVLYDQNQLTEARTPTCLDYNLLVNYNNTHPGELTMPYSVWTITNASRAEKLPFFKGDKCKVNIEFVNPCLDEALRNGEIDEWFYYTHSPSFIATGVDIDVQGTSSQGYPRRNYKTKLKKAKTWVYTKGSLAGLSLMDSHTVNDASGASHTISSKFHMDNENIGTNVFTWKIDYMESSGSYNTGFANLMGNPQYPLYTKHPLDDIQKGLGEGMRTTVYGYPVLTFHKYADGNNNPSNPGNEYEYIGRYNLNLDKGSNEYYGFESTVAQPYLTKSDGSHPLIKKIAECWELSDNQGTWTSWKYPNAAARATGFGTTWPDNPNRLEMIRHFEYRYSPYADLIDAIGADGKYDGITSDQEIINEIGTTDAQKSEYLRDKYQNLERLFNWIDSTNPDVATNNSITPITWVTSKEYTDDGETSIAVVGYNIVAEGSTFDKDAEYYVKVGEEYQLVDIDRFAEGMTYYTYSISYYNTTFSKDTAGYRLEKFRNELPLHLDKEYCLIYFIMTELLLCYDSRGKNMMIASWGPHEEGGDYIWYPIFYDIDTQLGLNNSGAYLWDYDADVTLDGLFSTPGSVLWNNFYKVFEEDIKNKYRALRGANDGSSVVNNLTYEKITGAYECDAEVFGSYAMKGIRPIIAIGLDEYYKYFATTKTGYFDTEGKTIIEGQPEYAYACQGDKKLTTELLLRNRLNYIDSWWSGGSYQINAVKQGQFWGRVNGNRGEKTSDTYLDLPQATLDANPEKYGNFTSGTYPVPYFDSQPGFKLKPFLKQYVSFFTDEVPGEPVKYNATVDEKDGVWTVVNADTIETYKTDPESPNEQLVYLPGVDYLSSLGDLSTSYFSEFTLTAGKRLLDLKLGSDIPGYKNDLLKAGDGGKFTIADTAGTTTVKSLLKKIIFTGITSLQGTVDVTGSEKLEEFRSLNTKLQNAYFAKGAPLHTVHLPKTIATLELVENLNLDTILTTKPVVCTLVNGEAVYAEPETYRGLYLEGITDYTNVNAGSGHNLNSLIIDGGGLGYGSYTILENLVKLKRGSSLELIVSLKNVNWSPYVLVEEGESPVANVTYYRLTDHSTFEEYDAINATATDWNYLTLNGKIYTYNSNYTMGVESKTITNLQMLDDFISDYENASSRTQFHNQSAVKSVPTITGVIYVDNSNGDPIAEDLFTSTYKLHFPNLSIYAANVNESFIAKFVLITDSGKEEELLLDKIRPVNGAVPEIHADLTPTKAYHDFIGWALSPDVTSRDDVVAEYSNGTFINHFDRASEAMTFNTETNTVITLYAIFVPHPFVGTFDLGTGVIETVTTPYSATVMGLNAPLTIPYKPYIISDTAMNDLGELGLYRTYKFLGWAFATDPETKVDLTKLKPDRDRAFVAMYEDVSVYDNVADEKYFLIVNNNLQINAEYYGVLSGKITIPATINGQKYTGISSFGGLNNSAITHIFFARSADGSAPVRINDSAFGNLTGLVYFEMPSSVRYIGTAAFAGCTALGTTDDSNGTLLAQMFITQKTIEVNAFSQDLGIKTLDLGSAAHIIANSAFSELRYLKRIIIGSPSSLSSLSLADLDNGTGHIFGNLTGRLIENNEGSVEIFLANGDPEAMFNSFDYRANKFLLTAHS